MLRAVSVVVMASIFSSAAFAQDAVPIAPATVTPEPVDEEDWGLAGDALTVVAAGLGAVLGTTTAAFASGPAAEVDWRLSVALATLPIVVPAGLAAGARALQPRPSALNVGLPAAGAGIGAGLGIAAVVGIIAPLWGPTQPGEGPAIAAIALSTIAGATMLTTAGAVALAHVIEGE